MQDFFIARENMYTFARSRNAEVRSGRIIRPIPHDVLEEKENQEFWTDIIVRLQLVGIMSIKEVTCYSVNSRPHSPTGIKAAVKSILRANAPALADRLGIMKEPNLTITNYATVDYPHARVCAVKDRDLARLQSGMAFILPKTIVSMLL